MEEQLQHQINKWNKDMDLPHVICMCPTKGRFTHMRKLIRCFLEQDYNGKHTLLIYNNGKDIQKLGEFDIPENKQIILINNYIHKKTGKPYSSLGQICNDILGIIDYLEPEVICLFEDDDMYKVNHITEGVKGLQRGNLDAYKPKKSWFIDSNGIRLAENVMEPSNFIKYTYLKNRGFGDSHADTHHHWYYDLVNTKKIFIDPTGIPTFIYDWSNRVFSWKTSGDPDNPMNFENGEKNSLDIGTGILTPITKEELEAYEPLYYKL